eukprot:2510210-Prymnesium_polylepis.1
MRHPTFATRALFARFVQTAERHKMSESFRSRDPTSVTPVTQRVRISSCAAGNWLWLAPPWQANQLIVSNPPLPRNAQLIANGVIELRNSDTL